MDVRFFFPHKMNIIAIAFTKTDMNEITVSLSKLRFSMIHVIKQLCKCLLRFYIKFTFRNVHFPKCAHILDF